MSLYLNIPSALQERECQSLLRKVQTDIFLLKELQKWSWLLVTIGMMFNLTELR
jgi:hypothetical protein